VSWRQSPGCDASLHFATSVMAALLPQSGAAAGALGWSYAAALGFALVYLGEHYAVDLIAGAALTAAVRRLGPARSRRSCASHARSRRSKRSRTGGQDVCPGALERVCGGELNALAQTTRTCCG